MSAGKKSTTTQFSNPTLLPGYEIAGKPTVLVVEDYDDAREMLRVWLELEGCRVVEACNGLEGVAAAGREKPALILMDGSLPLLGGLEATRLIREDARLREVVILGLNGWGTSSYRDAALAAGCDDCLEKPLDFERLESYLARLFEKSLVAATTDRSATPQLTARVNYDQQGYKCRQPELHESLVHRLLR